MGYKIYLEPVYDWSTEGWLSCFYSDMKKHALGFQLRVIQSFMECVELHRHSNEIILVERSIASSVSVFAHHLHQQGILNDIEYKLVQFYASHVDLFPHITVYIQTEPGICASRIIKRSRAEEQQIPLSYLEAIHKRHEQIFSGSAVHIVDGNQDIQAVIDRVLKILKNINVI